MNNIIERTLDRIDALLVRDGRDIMGNVFRADIGDLLREVHADGASPFATTRTSALASTSSMAVAVQREVRVVFTIANDDGTDAHELALAYQPVRIDIAVATRTVVDAVRAELLRRLTEAT